MLGGGEGHRCLVSIQIQVHTEAWEGARAVEGLIELQAWDQSPPRAQLRPEQSGAMCGVTGATYTTAAFSELMLSDQQVYYTGPQQTVSFSENAP